MKMKHILTVAILMILTLSSRATFRTQSSHNYTYDSNKNVLSETSNGMVMDDYVLVIRGEWKWWVLLPDAA